MDRSCTLFRLLFRPPREPTDYGCQREQQSALSNQRVRSVAASPQVILLLAEIHSENNTRVGHRRWNSRRAISRHRLVPSLSDVLPRVPSTVSYWLYNALYRSYIIRVYRITFSYRRLTA